MSFGGQIRVIPTMENKYDFGMGDKATGNFLPFLPAANQLSKDYFKNHANEAGGVNNSYIRSEDRLYFNALPTDRSWSFYAALEFDRALDTEVVDERGGKEEAATSDSNVSTAPWPCRFCRITCVFMRDGMSGA